ncbi:MAG: hypothetical protein OXC07_08335 [Kistimonas sp.]|nr:hypothetical protein [Kistimonas sp.]
MSIENSGIAPGYPGTPSGGQPPPGKGSGADEMDAQAFDQALHDNNNAGDGVEDTQSDPEQELRRIMAEQSMKQFMERSRELFEETKKNMEG